MRALVYHRFGDLNVLQFESMPAPALPADGVQVRVQAASINVIDSRSRRGEMSPFVNRRFPKIPGVDFAGIVSATGPKARRFKPGDAVFGATNVFKGGAFAETVAVPETAIAAKPAALGFEEAASLPVAGLAALTSLRELGKVRAGQRVLVYGSSGGVGLIAIQLARHFGAQVTAVCGPSGVEASREMGADEVLNHKAGQIAFTKAFDVILEYSGRFPFRVARRNLTPAGRFVESSPTIPIFLGSMLANLFRRQKHLMLTTTAKTAALDYLAAQVQSGVVRPTVARVFSFAEAREAFQLQEAGGVVGKVVVRM